jgi:hypothetical protein
LRVSLLLLKSILALARSLVSYFYGHKKVKIKKRVSIPLLWLLIKFNLNKGRPSALAALPARKESIKEIEVFMQKKISRNWSL